VADVESGEVAVEAVSEKTAEEHSEVAKFNAMFREEGVEGAEDLDSKSEVSEE
jgi:hypothetical protein